MYYDIILSGFGGQGILLTGDLLASAAMLEDKHVTWMPSYGVEMRGGAASCTVVVSSTRIGSPISEKIQGLISMSKPSLLKYQGRIRSGGLLVLNTSFADPDLVEREDITKICLPASEIAYQEVGEYKMANMVVLGAFAAHSGVVSLEKLEEAAEVLLTGRKKKLVPVVKKALNCGGSYKKYVRAVQPVKG